jgi:hypothetical protein
LFILANNTSRLTVTLYITQYLYTFTLNKIYEARHDKTNIVRLRSAWIQTSLCIRAVWSGSMLFAINCSTCNRVGKLAAWILIRLRGCAGWSGSMLVANQTHYVGFVMALLNYVMLYVMLCIASDNLIINFAV